MTGSEAGARGREGLSRLRLLGRSRESRVLGF